eukprot:TRINITY_DN4488_c1_g1_i2.p1 TRINITY_DN4488_c1_g1~~TRINITY_DN4488_c1_g1_i2.p1  ORF type:complete len:449 (-),score=25.53 TRINITY_DN4488_c1_g1_i2:208-1554(-)
MAGSPHRQRQYVYPPLPPPIIVPLFHLEECCLTPSPFLRLLFHPTVQGPTEVLKKVTRRDDIFFDASNQVTLDFSHLGLEPKTEDGSSPLDASTLMRMSHDDQSNFDQKRILFGSISDGSPRTYKSKHGLLDALLYAFNHHLPVIITPEHIWLSVLNGLMRYVDHHAERLRERFVRHQGQKELIVEVSRLSRATFEAQFIPGVRDLMKNHTTPGTMEWLETSFSGTSAREKLAGQLYTMSGFKAYFKYTIWILCGFPKVHIRGTPLDWGILVDKIQRIRDLDDDILTHWTSHLLWLVRRMRAPVVTPPEVMSAEEREEQEGFWQGAWSQGNCGCGGPCRYAGWFPILDPFQVQTPQPSELSHPAPGDVAANKEGNVTASLVYHLQNKNPGERLSAPMDEISGGMMTFPVHVNDNGLEYDTTAYHGLVGFEITPDGVLPRTDWLLVRDP